MKKGFALRFEQKKKIRKKVEKLLERLEPTAECRTSSHLPLPPCQQLLRQPDCLSVDSCDRVSYRARKMTPLAMLQFAGLPINVPSFRICRDNVACADDSMLDEIMATCEEESIVV